MRIRSFFLPLGCAGLLALLWAFPASAHNTASTASSSAGYVVAQAASCAGTDEVQTVTLTGATDGTFTLTLDANGSIATDGFMGSGVAGDPRTTGAIAYDASAATVETALEGIGNLAARDVSVSGSAGGPYTVTFAPDANSVYECKNVREMTADGTNLVGGTVGVSTATQGAGTTTGQYFECEGWINQTALNAVDSRLMCYVDSTVFPVNSADAHPASTEPPPLTVLCVAGTPDPNSQVPPERCGDGFPGRAAPEDWASPRTFLNMTDVDDGLGILSGNYNDLGPAGTSPTDTVTIQGCFDAFDPKNALGPNVFVKSTLYQTDHPKATTGEVDIWLFHGTSVSCPDPAPGDTDWESGDAGTAPTINDAPTTLIEAPTTDGGHGTSPPTHDQDKDGCSDERETRSAQSQGGRRDPLNRWDFMDVPTGTGLARDKSVSGADISAVVGRFGANDSTMPAFNRYSNPLSTPNATVTPSGSAANYHPGYDRGGSLLGGNTWNLKPPNGAVDGGDISAAVGQFGQNCL